MAAAKIKNQLKRAGLLLTSLLITVLVFLPTPTAYAATQLTNREARVTTTEPSTTFNITFEFDTTDIGSSSDVEGIEIEFCDQPIGTCTGSNIPTIPAASTVSQSGWDGATAFGSYTRQSGDNGGTDNQIKVSRTDATNENNNTNVVIAFTGLTNDPVANLTYYPRIRLYSDSATTALVWEGAVAQSTAQQLTINARVQEVLEFCVGTDDAGSTNDCDDISGGTVDIGVVGSSAVNISPVAAGSGGNNKNGFAMVRTNAVNGVVIDYFAEQDTSSGKLKVVGAACSGVSTTDQCFNSTGTTQNSIVAGTEEFGMTISSVDTSNGTTTNLVRDTEYDGDGTAAGGWAWDDTGSTDRIASSAGSSVKVVDDEMLVLRFAATAQVTTPTGSYSVTSTFIATATY